MPLRGIGQCHNPITSGPRMSRFKKVTFVSHIYSHFFSPYGKRRTKNNAQGDTNRLRSCCKTISLADANRHSDDDPSGYENGGWGGRSKVLMT